MLGPKHARDRIPWNKLHIPVGWFEQLWITLCTHCIGGIARVATQSTRGISVQMTRYCGE